MIYVNILPTYLIFTIFTFYHPQVFSEGAATQRIVYVPESIEWFIEDQAFSPPYRIIWLLHQPSRPSPVSSTDDKQKEWERQVAEEGEGRGWGRSQIIRRRKSLFLSKLFQYSLIWPNSAQVKTSNTFIRVELNKYSARLKGQPSIVINIFVAVGPANNLASKCWLFTTSLYRRPAGRFFMSAMALHSAARISLRRCLFLRPLKSFLT